MLLNSHAFRKVTIVGVGLMGGSLGMAIKKHNLAKEVVGLSQKQSSLVEAIRMNAIDTAATDIPEAIRNADLIVLATPVDSIVKLLATINPYIRRGCFVTDIGSAKVSIIETAQKTLSNPAFFVGSHPLVGSEKTGVEFSRAELFENARCIMTPTGQSHPAAKEKIKFFWEKIGAKVSILTPEEHDRILAYISHLPHLLAYGLIHTIPSDILEYATQGLKDTTRIAGSSPQMWNDICLANSTNLVRSLDDLVKNLAMLRKAIVGKDEDTLMQTFTKAKEKRDGISG